MDNGDRRTKPDALGGKVFTVVDVTSEEPYPGSGTHYTLKLEGNGETIYYSYKKGNAVYVNPINFTLPDDYYCSYITENKDSSGNKRFIGEKRFLYRVYKVYLTDSYGYGIELMTAKDSKETGKGVTILLDNGEKIVKPDAAIKMDDSRSTSRFNAIFTLTDEDVHLLANNKVLSYTLYKHEQAVYNPEVLQGMFKCLLTKE
ncbi:hypothetical protein GCM10007424_25040 [Flavobacterium suaedae]|uniref:Uncharacterized protein n=1 Tax=Flavobacterium suaedae TaxID=1767027 RepID=A0ABQ1K1W2_9FLAO|nr:hypothetical protein [Flavobacterium suaedae]GGB84030.1 hypothetical protein GCM10007424_25040 [Flavobacterium suaedae]